MSSQDNSPNTELNNDIQTGGPSYAPPSSPKRSKAPLIIGVAAAVVVLCVVCVAVAILGRQYLAFLLTPKLAAPELVPADTVFFASINPSVQGLAGYKHLADVYGDIPEVEDALDDFSKEMEEELGISFEDDVMPWLGSEVAIAVTDVQTLIEDEEPVVIVAAVTRDTRASDAFLEKVREYLEDQGYDVEEEAYESVTYYVQEVEYDWETPLIFGTVKKSVVLTTGKDAMEDVIDVAQGKTNALAKNERYTELMDSLPDDALAYTFFDMEDMAKAFLESLEEEGIELPRETSEQLEAPQAFGLALSLDEEGIQFDVAVTFDPDLLSSEMLDSSGAKASANRILKRIPNDALGFISGQNLAAGWESILATMQKTPDFEEQIDDLEDELGVRIDEDLFGWLTGEFAVAVVKAKGIDEEIPVGGFAIFEVDDQKEAEDVIEGIVDIVEELAFVEFGHAGINDVEMQVLMDPYTEEIILGYGFTDEHLVIGFTEDALEAAVDDDIRSIADDETFKRVQKHLPSKTGGYFYVNIEAIWRLAYNSMSEYDKEAFNEEIRPFLGPIRAIGVAASPPDPEKGIGQSTLFIYISED
jgi:hypothetical protein